MLEINKDEPLDIAPGQSFFLEVTILDQDGRVYNDQNNADAAVIFHDRDSIDELSAILNYQAVADEGVFTFEGLNILTTPLS